MDRTFVLENHRRTGIDRVFLSVMVLLAGLGLVSLFSASYSYGARVFSDPLFFLNRQLVYLAISLAAAFGAARIPMDTVRKLIPFLLIGTLVLLGAAFLPGIGKELQGARRWIVVFGVSFQPSELVKLSLVLYLAHIFEKNLHRMTQAINAVAPPAIVSGVLIFLVLAQNDFSTAVYLAVLATSIFFIAGVQIRYFLGLIFLGGPLAVMMLLRRPHRALRLAVFFDPQSDPSGAGYQVLASLSALARGGFWGAGWGLGTKKLGGLPEAYSDFIFAVLAEETGFVGVFCLILLFGVFALRGYLVALEAESPFESYLAFGLTTSVVLQAFFNMAVVSGVFPATGIPLPFFSSGGSSLLVTSIMCGLLLNLRRGREAKK